MTTDKRKQQQNKSQQNTRQEKRKSGFVLWPIWVKEEWKPIIKRWLKKKRLKDGENG